MENQRLEARQNERRLFRQGTRALRMVLAVVLTVLAVGCPLPYQYSEQGWAGNASAVDPSSPSITASPTLGYAASAGGSGTLSDTGTGTTSSDTTITLQTATPGSVIYYTTDGTTPDPRGAHTSRYTPGVPLTLSIAAPTVDDSSRTLTVKASAIGPNMKPSLVTSATVNLQYPQAAAPSFSIPGQAYTSDQALDLSTTTAGAAIYYTMVSGPGPAPRPVPGQAGTLPYTGSISVNGPSNTWTIAAFAVKGQMIDSTTATASYSVAYPGLPAPDLSPSAGTYSNDQTVTITSAGGSTIWYTVDGSAPVPGTSPSVPSGGSMTLAGGASGTGIVTIRAIATQTGMNNSPERTASYTFQTATPTCSVRGGTYANDQTVILATATAGAVIHYTMDGSTPTQGSPAYGSPLTVNATATTIRSIAVKAGYAQSSERADVYILKVAPPNFAPAGGNYPYSLPVTLSDATNGTVTIYYTTDGTQPATWSTIYTGSPISMPNGAATTVRAFAAKPGYLDSQEASVTYVIPALPTGLAARSAWLDSIFVSWNAVPSALSYTVLRDTSPSFPAPFYLYPASNSVTDTGLSQGVTYYYKVRAVYSGGTGDPSAAATGVTLLLSQAPVVQTVTTTGFTAPTVMPPGAPAPEYWLGMKQPGWVGGGRTYVVWDPDNQNWGSFAIAAYDSNAALVGQWIITGNRYIGSITLNSATGNLMFTGQNGTTQVPWYTIMP